MKAFKRRGVMNIKTAKELLQNSLKDIFAFSISRLYDKQAAEDLTNDIVVEVLSSIDRLQNDEAFYGYMWKIAENTFKRFIRKNTFEYSEFNENFCGAYWDTPEDKYIEKEELVILRRELSLLSKQYREVTVNFYIHNKTVAEISKETKISEEMVKYYLFKTRKILKEGVNMEREYGEKSYNPCQFAINFWGGGGSNNYVWQTFERRLPGNIVLATYDKPLTIKELSLELGVGAPYLEDELEILIRNRFIREIGDKYQTDFVIFKTLYELEFQKTVPTSKICDNTSLQIKQITENLLPNFCKKDFGIVLDENAMRWFVVNFILLNALGDFEEKIVKKRFGQYPKLLGETHGFVYGHDNEYKFNHFEGIYGCCFNKQQTAYYTAVNYGVTANCQRWMGGNMLRTERMCDAILGNSARDDDITVAQLISENMIKIENEMLKANYPVFTSRENYLMRKELQQVIDNTVICMDKICKLATTIFKKYVPKHLNDRYEQLCYIRHMADPMAIIVEKLVEEGYLVIPEKPTNLTVFGVKRLSD